MEKISPKEDFVHGVLRKSDFPTDSPCCSRIGIHTIFSLIPSNQWAIESTNVKTTFLQGKQIGRTVYLCPPREANMLSIWKLQKCVYGFANASRYWYLPVREELVKLGAKLSSADPGIFYWQHGSGLIGTLAFHVDDMYGEELNILKAVSYII